ncbi:WaRThog (Hedgehog family) [Trichostrongylus colubriformis]|uniref:WaRThog (Hedgehog family) n=1 Tax=Trichostrongylus colubriformis TaxID=6319 RepID=A0AAN8FI45_TRICO
MIQKALWCLLSLHLARYSQASFCGQAAIPFTFQVLHSGLPVLGCARPTCFGWNANGTRADDTAQFYRISGKEDGYLRRSDEVARSPSHDQGMVARVAKCEETYSKQGCVAGQWIGGIAPQSPGQGSELQVRCCWYAPLIEAEDRGVAMVTNGQLVVGGEVMDGDVLEGFDYIADIRTEGVKNGRTVYAVSIRRMICTDDNSVSENAVLQRLDGDAQPRHKKRIASKSVLDHPHRIINTAHVSSTPPADYQTALSTYTQQIPIGYGASAAPPAPQYNTPHGSANYGGAPAYQQPVVPQPLSQPSQPQYIAAQMGNVIQSPGVQTAIPASQYSPYYPVPIQQAPQPLAPVYGQQPNSFMSLQQFPTAPQQQAQPQPQPLLQLQEPQAVLTTPLPTLPPLTFPSLDQIPKIDIPSVEDVENVIPPVQRAILTTVARFFGVL